MAAADETPRTLQALSGDVTSTGTMAGTGGTMAVDENGTSSDENETSTGEPDIAVSPTSHDFGEVDVGDSERKLIEVANEGDAPLDVHGSAFAGADAGEFHIERGGKSIRLSPGESYTIKLRFEPTAAESASATLEIASNDTDESPATVSLSGSGESTTTSTATPDESLSVDVDRPAPGNASIEIRNAEAGEPVNVTFDGGVGYDGVYLDGLDLELDRDADEIDLDVRHRRSTPDGAERLRIVAGADRYVEIEKSGITNDGIDAARFHFRMSGDALGDREPENVALHRYDDGEWSTLPTTFVEERSDEYVFRATAPGFSAFAVGVQRAQFEVNGTDLDPTSVTVGENATVEAAIENTGEAAGTYTVGLTADDETVATRNVSLEAGESTTVAFEVGFEDASDYDLAVNGTVVGTLSVEAEATPTPTVTVEPTTAGETGTADATETTAEPTSTEEVETTPPATATVTSTAAEESELPLFAISLGGVLAVLLSLVGLYFRA